MGHPVQDLLNVTVGYSILPKNFMKGAMESRAVTQVLKLERNLGIVRRRCCRRLARYLDPLQLVKRAQRRLFSVVCLFLCPHYLGEHRRHRRRTLFRRQSDVDGKRQI